MRTIREPSSSLIPKISGVVACFVCRSVRFMMPFLLLCCSHSRPIHSCVGRVGLPVQTRPLHRAACLHFVPFLTVPTNCPSFTDHTLIHLMLSRGSVNKEWASSITSAFSTDPLSHSLTMWCGFAWA